jgi:DNA-binding CsgD family transcriptional regulator
MADTLDGLSASLFIVDADRRIVHANSAGHVVLSTGDILRNAAGRLAAREADFDQSLRDALAAAASSATVASVKGIAIPLTARDGTRHVAHVLSLTSVRRAGKVYAAGAAVFVTEAALDTPSASGIIAKAYKLTPAELRIMLAIFEIGGVPEIATALGIAKSTVKTHLNRLFQKTATTRQAELVKIVAGFAMGLASSRTARSFGAAPTSRRSRS